MPEEIKHRYVFPNLIASVMSKVDMRTQMEASLLSMTLIMIGMLVSLVYMVIYGDFTHFFKGTLIFNGICGVIFMSSFLVTTYQQYLGYMEAKDIQDAMAQEVKK